MKRAAAVAAIGAAMGLCGCESEPSPPATTVIHCSNGNQNLIVDETGRQLKRQRGQLRPCPGTQKFTVIVPKSASGKHGVAFDGGPYDHVEGAAVGAGRATSLTLPLKPGSYTIYDPVGDNRKRGYQARIVVKARSDKSGPSKEVRLWQGIP